MNGAAVHVELARARIAHFADQAFDLLLPLALRARNELLVRHRLRRHRRVDAFFQVALDLANPHGRPPEAMNLREYSRISFARLRGGFAFICIRLRLQSALLNQLVDLHSLGRHLQVNAE